MKAIKQEVDRRGDPLLKTGWSLSQIKKFVKTQLVDMEEGRLHSSKLGGFAYQLPSKSKDGRPASVPVRVTDPRPVF